MRRLILLVDDAPFQRKAQHLVLELNVPEADVFACASAQEAFAQVLERHPDVLVTDWIMPGLKNRAAGGGSQLLMMLRALGFHMPIIVFSSATEAGARAAAKALGAHWIDKGRWDELVVAVRELLALGPRAAP